MAQSSEFPNPDDESSTLRTVLGQLGITAAVVTWSGFWLTVARAHLVAGSVGANWRNAAFTILALVVPAVAWWLWQLPVTLGDAAEVAPVDTEQLPV